MSSSASEGLLFFALVINGSLAGAIYALIALAFVLVYKASRMINFALGEWIMFGSLLASTGVAYDRVDCDADFRALRSVWPRRHGDIIEAVVFTAVAQARFAPRLFDDVEGLGKAFLAFQVRYAIGLVSPREAAAPDAEDQPAAADLVDGRRLLGQA